MKRNKGITLIAVVITIIILLILAGVSINVISNQDGIIKKTINAKNKNEESLYDEKIKLSVLTALTEAGGEGETEKFYKKLNEELDKIEEGKGNIEYLPAEIEIKGKRYVIRKNGEVEQLGEKRWTYKKDDNGRETIVTNGIWDLTIGTYINYRAYITDAEGKNVEEKLD